LFHLLPEKKVKAYLVGCWKNKTIFPIKGFFSNPREANTRTEDLKVLCVAADALSKNCGYARNAVGVVGNIWGNSNKQWAA
jgi:hypothetical protein